MDSLASNEEQVVLGADAAEDRLPFEDTGEAAVANRREFFTEADEVREALRKAVQPDLEPRACREVCGRVGSIWGQYQEQPGLLDPFLEEMVEPLIGAIGSAVHQNPAKPAAALPNLHLLSSLLYILTTVRGYKTVARFFPHEAADLEPCLEASEAEAAAGRTDTWSTLYCLTLWLGMVLLTPFDLQSIDSGGGPTSLRDRILELGLSGLRSTSRVRDASAWMLAKHFTRPDVAAAGALRSLLQWTRAAWAPSEDGSTGPAMALAFARCGALQAWNQTLKTAPRSALKPMWEEVLDLALHGPGSHGDADFQGSSILRKLRVAVACRAGLVALPPRLAPWRYDRGARSLLVNFAQTADPSLSSGATGSTADPSTSAAGRQPAAGLAEAGGSGQAEDEDEEGGDTPEQVEEVLELLLASLCDADTVVRWAAAKGVGRITGRLPRDFGDQVLESLLERCFSFRETDKAWHGGCLAMAELTRRGLLLPDRLPAVVPLVCQALHFEQVSGNHAVGQHVRDAACYVCWAFARAYAPDVLQPFVGEIASALIQVAVYDREINCRRAAAAAVQEHVGRQGTFPNGIDVVTIADYWSLSARRQAYLSVAPQLADLGDGVYRTVLADHLVNRKLQHQEVQIRILASQALGKLAETSCEAFVVHLNGVVLPKLVARALEAESSAAAGGSSAAPTAAGAGLGAGTVQARHGAVAGVAALVEALQERVTAENQTAIRNLVPGLEKARAYRGRGGEVVRQAACNLLAAISAAKSWPFKDATCVRYLQTVDECARHTTEAVQVAAVDALRQLAHLRLKPELCVKCAETYLAGLAKADETVAARRGFSLCLGALPVAALGAVAGPRVLAALCQEVKGVDLPGGKDQDDPQTRQYAVLSLGRFCLAASLTGSELSEALGALDAALHDYAVDRRGDVGSWVREAALEAIIAILDMQRRGAPGQAPRIEDPTVSTRLVALLLQQSVEKIDRLRDRAFGLLQRLLIGDTTTVRPFDIEAAYRRICHGEAYDPVTCEEVSPTRAAANPDACASTPATASSISTAGWPPAHITELTAAVHSDKVCESATSGGQDAAALGSSAIRTADRNADIFDALVPLLACEAYRPALVLGLVVSVGGLTEHTAKDAKRALLRFLHPDDVDEAAKRASAVSTELLNIFDNVGTSDADGEAKRVLSPLLNTVGILLAEGVIPAEFASGLYDRAVASVKNSRDISRLRSSIAVFVGLLRWPRGVRRRSLAVLLQFLGYSFPTVRQAAAQALYIRLLEEVGELDLGEGEASVMVSEAVVGEVLELISVTPWGTNNEEALAAALREAYAKLGLELPSSGRSVLAPKKPKAERKPKGAEYADLVRESHF